MQPTTAPATLRAAERIPREEFFVPYTDARRQLGALIDLLLSFALLVLGVLLCLAAPAVERWFPIVMVAAVLLDVAWYVLPVSTWGWSIGGLLTGRRVIDRATGGPVTLRRAFDRYVARRTAGLRLRGVVRTELVGRVERVEEADPTMSMADRAVGTAVVSARLWGSSVIRP